MNNDTNVYIFLNLRSSNILIYLNYISQTSCILVFINELHAVRGYFGPHMRPKNKSCLLLVTSYKMTAKIG